MTNLLKEKWRNLADKIDGMSMRERVLIFAAMVFLLVSIINAVFIDPLRAQQKMLSMQVVQQQEKMKEIQANFAALSQAKINDANSPQRARIRALQAQIAEGDDFLKSQRDKLVPPEKMGKLLEEVLSKNTHLELVNMSTLPATPLIEIPLTKKDDSSAAVKADIKSTESADRKIYKHGVTITLRGSYLDLLQYLNALEKLPTQMFWGAAKMSVAKYPTVELTLTLYTLSLDAIWLRV